jgi:uncharacterized RDD family membrane protein YckC
MEPDRPPLARLLGAGAKAGERVAHATGADRALDDAVEEAIVRALRSPGVERAVVRVIHHNAVQDAIGDALTSDEVAQAIIRALDSEAADKVWADLLAGPKVQMLVERIAEAPEVRAAIASQGAGLITDIGIRLTVITEALDDAVERIAHRHHEEETDQAGLVTRAVAAAVDVGLAMLAYSLFSGMLASVIPFAFGDTLSLPAAIVLGALGVLASGAILVAFWALAGQTPGMRFLSIRLEPKELGFRRAVRRLLALPLAILPFGLGFLAIVRHPRRRGWHDRIAGTEVVYDSARRTAPHSGGTTGPSAVERAA